MLPDDVEVAKIECRRLRVGDVGLGALAHQDAARRADALRPAQLEHPASHVEHVNAHVAHDPVAVFHERPPSARMDDRIKGPHGGGPGPHFLVEVIRRVGVGRVGIVPHMVVAINLDQTDLAELAFADDPVAGLDQVRVCCGAGCRPARRAGACGPRRAWPGLRSRRH